MNFFLIGSLNWGFTKFPSIYLIFYAHHYYCVLAIMETILLTCLMILESHRWLSLLSHLCNDTGCYEGYAMISYAKILILHMGQNSICSWQERSFLAVKDISVSRKCLGTQILFVGNCRCISRFGISTN